MSVEFSSVKSLHARGADLSDPREQVRVLEAAPETSAQPRFRERLSELGLHPLMPTGLEVLQLNLGKMCNQTCTHCHVDAGPDRREIMSRETMEQCLVALDACPEFTAVDLTGGAPEMNPNFRWFAERISERGRQVIVRCNLTIINANKRYADLPQFYRKHGIEVVSSLPFYTRGRTDQQRGDGVFESSITALKALNEVGYGKEGSGLTLNLVYNPCGAFLPPSQNALECEFKRGLAEDFGIVFNQLFAITNLPISRYLDYLIQSGNYRAYMERLIEAWNPQAAAKVMCRNTVSVGWDGLLYDCDFNQMLGLGVAASCHHIADFDGEALRARQIRVGQHCFGCTAGAGSSCGGEVS